MYICMYIEDGFLYKINIWYTEQSLTNVDIWVRWIVYYISCWIFILTNIFRAFSGEWSRHDFIGKQILTLHAMTLSNRHLLFGTNTYKKTFLHVFRYMTHTLTSAHKYVCVFFIWIDMHSEQRKSVTKRREKKNNTKVPTTQ